MSALSFMAAIFYFQHQSAARGAFMEDPTLASREELFWKYHEADKAKRDIRKRIKRNRKPQRVRHKDWMPDNWDDLEDFEAPQFERIMPRGERERRQTIMAETLAELEEEPNIIATARKGGLVAQRGVVIEVSSGICRVAVAGEIMICSLRGALSAAETGYTNVVAVGDEVLVTRNGDEQGVVEEVLPRRSVLARPDVFHGHLQQVIVANAEQLLIVAAWREPAIWFELIDRYLIAAARFKLKPTICVNKVDLTTNMAECRRALQPYTELGYRVIFTSALTGAGIAELCDLLRGYTTVLAGLSGVGKSSLLIELQPDLQLRVGEVSARHHEGQHTTTQVTLLHLEEIDAFVADTPGIREFGVSGLRRAELVSFYPEIAAAAQWCRFRDCTHISEPDCAVQAAAQKGRVSPTRYHSYKQIYASLPS